MLLFGPLRHIDKELMGLTTNTMGGSSKRYSEAIKHYILGDMQITGDYKLDRKRVSNAIKMVLGNTPVDVNGSTLMPPRGMEKDKFLDRLTLVSKISAGEFNPYWSQYMNVGRGQYALVKYGSPKVNKDGNTIIVNPSDAPTDKLMDTREERRLSRRIPLLESQIFQN